MFLAAYLTAMMAGHESASEYAEKRSPTIAARVLPLGEEARFVCRAIVHRMDLGTIGARLFQLAGAAFLVAVCYQLSKGWAKDHGVTRRTIAGHFVGCILLAGFLAVTLGASHVDDGYPLDDGEDAAPIITTRDRWEYAGLIIALTALPAAAGLYIGAAAHRQEQDPSAARC